MTQAENRSTSTRLTGSSESTLDGHGPRGEQDLRAEQDLRGVQRATEQATDRVRAATSKPADAFAGTPDMSKVLTAWFDMAEDMMKLQQQFFSTVLHAGNTKTRTTTKV